MTSEHQFVDMFTKQAGEVAKAIGLNQNLAMAEEGVDSKGKRRFYNF